MPAETDPPIARRREDGRVHLSGAGGEPRQSGAHVVVREGSRSGVEGADAETLGRRIVEVLRSIYDPEIPVNIHDLGLVYACEVRPDGDVEIAMTLTAPGCPVAGDIVEEVAGRVAGLEGVRAVRVRLVWDPPWTRERMSEEARLELGFL